MMTLEQALPELFFTGIVILIGCVLAVAAYIRLPAPAGRRVLAIMTSVVVLWMDFQTFLLGGMKGDGNLGASFIPLFIVVGMAVYFVLGYLDRRSLVANKPSERPLAAAMDRPAFDRN